MKNDTPGRFGGYARFAVSALTVTILIGLIGYYPTRSGWGPLAIPAMWAGCGISLVSGLIGGVAQLSPRGSQPGAALGAAGAAMGLRFILAVALGTAVALAEVVERPPLLIWWGLSYLALLPVETLYALRSVRNPK